jgi:hypothetical protein
LANNVLPPIPQDEIKENPRWREWFRNLGSYIQQAQVGNIIIGIVSGGTGATTASGARQNLGLGTLAVQNSNSVAIGGGTISGVGISSSAITGGTVTSAVYPTNGVSGTFKSGDPVPKVITVTNGIITSIV